MWRTPSWPPKLLRTLLLPMPVQVLPVPRFRDCLGKVAFFGTLLSTFVGPSTVKAGPPSSVADGFRIDAKVRPGRKHYVSLSLSRPPSHTSPRQALGLFVRDRQSFPAIWICGRSPLRGWTPSRHMYLSISLCRSISLSFCLSLSLSPSLSLCCPYLFL